MASPENWVLTIAGVIALAVYIVRTLFTMLAERSHLAISGKQLIVDADHQKISDQQVLISERNADLAARALQDTLAKQAMENILKVHDLEKSLWEKGADNNKLLAKVDVLEKKLDEANDLIKHLNAQITDLQGQIKTLIGTKTQPLGEAGPVGTITTAINKVMDDRMAQLAGVTMPKPQVAGDTLVVTAPVELKVILPDNPADPFLPS